MRVVERILNGLVLLESKAFTDSRGLFFESFNQKLFDELIDEKINFIQDNHSSSIQNVIRGLHLQAPPFAQGKLVRVASGKVYDIAVDVRKSSPTYGKHFGIELSDQNNLMLWIPPGFAHGFSTLENNSIFLYKCTGYYNKSAEMTILHNDPDLMINWKVNNPVISDKDLEGTSFKTFNSPFN